ncbi:hypothetical protein MJ258_16585 [Legionella sp. EUR-108]|uniref:hypothetical protein n=1 Tax=Legionella maioricensis TaxID=2896528 RepID=UPI002028F76D|nr:hypothetical protein [Legionella maioricensis]MCL9689139.1 hypothetical protein [Legionella maioricensis]
MLYELSYIRKNLIEKIPAKFFLFIMILLFILVITKTINLIISIPNVLIIEIFILILLFLSTLYWRINLILAALVFIVCLGFIVNPFLLLFCLVFLHNLTPWGFLALQKATCKAWVIFLINPVLVFLFAFFFAIDPHYISSTTTQAYLSHYLLSPKLSSLNIAFFAAAIYLQMTHYYFVLNVLPKLSVTPIKTNKIQLIFFTLIGIGFILFFKYGKLLYSIVAMFHAYLEIPFLFYLLGVKAQVIQPASRQSMSPSNG